jgi:drug/metabolite transporter (DMT)-like permease
MIGGAVFFQVLARIRPRSLSSARLERRMHAKLFGLALLGVAFNQGLFLAGLRVSTPFTVSLLGVMIPVFAAALAVLLRKEPASWRHALGLALAMSGVLWLTGVGSLTSQSTAPASFDKGAAIVALNSLCYAGYVVFSRDVVREIGSGRLMTWAFTYAALAFAPLGLPALASAAPLLTPRGILLLAYIVLVPTILAYWLNAWALARSSASTVTIYIYTQPLIAGLWARLQLGYGISSRAGLASLLILGGVALSTAKLRQRQLSADA